MYIASASQIFSVRPFPLKCPFMESNICFPTVSASLRAHHLPGPMANVPSQSHIEFPYLLGSAAAITDEDYQWYEVSSGRPDFTVLDAEVIKVLGEVRKAKENVVADAYVVDPAAVIRGSHAPASLSSWVEAIEALKLMTMTDVMTGAPSDSSNVDVTERYLGRVGATR